ncbi:hypothetical protein FKP32DRAFT_38126 [Trametes sanguinea]|nr:hypothetical protein FKP32DRAFT_38126 [Trametes sanguinea]
MSQGWWIDSGRSRVSQDRVVVVVECQAQVAVNVEDEVNVDDDGGRAYMDPAAPLPRNRGGTFMCFCSSVVRASPTTSSAFSLTESLVFLADNDVSERVVRVLVRLCRARNLSVPGQLLQRSVFSTPSSPSRSHMGRACQDRTYSRTDLLANRLWEGQHISSLSVARCCWTARICRAHLSASNCRGNAYELSLDVQR